MQPEAGSGIIRIPQRAVLSGGKRRIQDEPDHYHQPGVRERRQRVGTPPVGAPGLRLLRPGDRPGDRQAHGAVREVRTAGHRAPAHLLLSHPYRPQLPADARPPSGAELQHLPGAVQHPAGDGGQVGLRHRGPLRGLHPAGGGTLPHLRVRGYAQQDAPLPGEGLREGGPDRPGAGAPHQRRQPQPRRIL